MNRILNALFFSEVTIFDHVFITPCKRYMSYTDKIIIPDNDTS